MLQKFSIRNKQHAIGTEVRKDSSGCSRKEWKGRDGGGTKLERETRAGSWWIPGKSFGFTLKETEATGEFLLERICRGCGRHGGERESGGDVNGRVQGKKGKQGKSHPGGRIYGPGEFLWEKKDAHSPGPSPCRDGSSNHRDGVWTERVRATNEEGESRYLKEKTVGSVSPGEVAFREPRDAQCRCPAAVGTQSSRSFVPSFTP